MQKVVSEFDRLKATSEIKSQFKVMSVDDMENMEKAFPEWSPQESYNKQIKVLPSQLKDMDVIGAGEVFINTLEVRGTNQNIYLNTIKFNQQTKNLKAEEIFRIDSYPL